MSNTFFISDMHHGHKNILSYEPLRKEKFGDIKNHDLQLILNWNSVIKPDDVVWVLGDPFICGNTYAKEILSSLLGRKRLVMGNHDLARSQSQWERMGFEIALHAVKIKVDDKLVWLSHYPYRGDSVDDRYNNLKLKDEGDWLFHGHCHSKGERIRGKQINVGVDVNNFFPVNEIELIKIMRKTL